MDYQALNKRTKVDRSSLRRFAEMMDKVTESKSFSRLNMFAGFRKLSYWKPLEKILHLVEILNLPSVKLYHWEYEYTVYISEYDKKYFQGSWICESMY